jgi:carbamoyl-phosphate synthase large subunit
VKTIPGNKLLLDHYLDGAIEAEADAICDGENVYIIELWSTSSLVVCTLETVTRLTTFLGICDAADKDHTKKIALALRTVGLINISLLSKMILFT